MNELQLEGADVYMSTFAALKNYPFFREVHNWFYPFSKQQSDVIKQLKQEGNEKNTLLDLILQSGFFSNSDKYSLFFHDPAVAKGAARHDAKPARMNNKWQNWPRSRVRKQ